MTDTVMSRPSSRALVGLEFFTGVTALIGGLLLTIDPDGSLLQAESSALEGSPFGDWRIPGLALMTFVGGGFLLASMWQWRGAAHARELSMFAGIGLVVFEIVEFVWIGFQPLEVVFGAVGVVVFALARRHSRHPSSG